MAEVGTVLSIISLAGDVIQSFSYWIGAVQNAPTDMVSIFLETSMLRGVLNDVELLIEHNENFAATISTLSKPNGAIDHCRRILEDLLDLLPKAQGSGNVNSAAKRGKTGTVKQKFEAVKSGLCWGVRQGKAQKLLEELGRYKHLINLALTAASM
jgi:hypothetical protein